MESIGDLFSGVNGFINSVTSFLTGITSFWFVFVPLLLVASAKVIGAGKGLLFFRRGRRR